MMCIVGLILVMDILTIYFLSIVFLAIIAAPILILKVKIKKNIRYNKGFFKYCVIFYVENVLCAENL